MPITNTEIEFLETRLNSVFLSKRLRFQPLFNFFAPKIHFYFKRAPRKFIFGHQGSIDLKSLQIIALEQEYR